MPSTHWCHRCERFVSSTNEHIILCPDCGSGFIEDLSDSPHVPLSPRHLLRSFPPPPPPPPSSFNPVIVLRNPQSDSDSSHDYHLYYDGGAGLGLRPLPVTFSEFLMGSGFDRLLHHLSHVDLNALTPVPNPPASKSSVASLPVLKIGANQVSTDSHCAVCKEAFEVDNDAREMPCKHIYHADCILPWLSIRNSCPVCRYELPAEAEGAPEEEEEEAVGLTIWRLPGGGFAVGRFSGGRRLAEREVPAVYTEMDGRFGENGSGSGAPRRITWDLSGERSGQGRGLGRVLRSVASFFRGGRSSSSGSELRLSGRRSRSSSIFRRRRQRQDWTFGV